MPVCEGVEARGCSRRLGERADAHMSTLGPLRSVVILDWTQEVQSMGYMQGLSLAPIPDEYTTLWASVSAEPWLLR